MSYADDQIMNVQRQARDELEAAKTPAELEAFRIKYLGTKGVLKGMMKILGTAPVEQKKILGQRLNALYNEVNAAYDARKTDIESTSLAGKDAIDVTEPGKLPAVGKLHIVNRVADELSDLFSRLGFTVAAGPELEDEWHNFVALNIPSSHPARDPNDNFYLLSPGGSQLTDTLLRTQTSTVQIRVMETQPPPIRVVIPGRVYRPDTTDATHLPMFHQLEALVIDKGVTMVDLKSTVLQFVRGYFGPDTKIRFRPSFFPFTEPSAEVDVWFEDKQRWIELGGCGMVHPNVLRNCKIDPEVYSGWAFGFGIERIAMRKYGVQDIRGFIENDIRFLSQF